LRRCDEPRRRAVERDAADRFPPSAKREARAELPALHLPELREPVHASGGDESPVATELDVEDPDSVAVDDVELPPGQQRIQRELAAFRPGLTGPRAG
jgi:hypothetical protein